MICQKNVAAGGRGLIFLYKCIYIENFKIKIFMSETTGLISL